MGFRMMEPPDHMVMPETVQLVTTVVLAALCACFLAIALRDLWRTGTLIGVLMIAGGAICAINEANVDVLGNVWHPREGDWNLYHTIAPVPVWVGFAYCLFEGGMAYTLYKRVKRGLTTSQLWLSFAVVYAANFALEIPLLALDFYDYFGNPPLEVFGFPLYWPFVNLPAIYITAALLVRAPQMFRGWRVGFLLVEPIVAYAAVSAAVGWPVWAVLHMTSESELVNTLAGLGTIGLSCSILSLVFATIATDGALNQGARSRPAEDGPLPADPEGGSREPEPAPVGAV